MPDGIRWVGLDVHARQSTFAVFDQATGEVSTKPMVGHPHELPPYLRGIERPVRMVYEAGPTGYALARRALAEGIEIVGVGQVRASARGPGQDRKRDAVRLARLLAAGELVLVTIPSVEREQLRDLVRCWEDIRADLVRARQRGCRSRASAGSECMDCRRHPSRTYVRTLVKLGPRARTRRGILFLASMVGRIVRSVVAFDRVQERRRAVALAQHYRDEEGLSMAEIARRLGRAEATVKAYLYDPSQANKRPFGQPAGATVLGGLVIHGRRSASDFRALAATAPGRRPPDCPICPEGAVSRTPPLVAPLGGRAEER